MLARRIARDTKERGRSVDGILEQYEFLRRSYVVAQRLKVPSLCQAIL